MDSPEPRVTICVIPRERFSCAVDSLRNMARITTGEFDLLYIDGNSPSSIGTELQDICREHGFTYRRYDHYLSPNLARNNALELIDTPFVLFADNDLFVYPGWLQAMLDCAEQTGAWAVTPTILEGGSMPRVVHMAGGEYHEEQRGEYTHYRQRHRYIRQLLSDVQPVLKRETVGFFEFHCVLLRSAVFSEKRFLDEAFLAHNEHLDHSREIYRAGGEVWLEPGAVVRYDNARPFQDYDREFFELRWSEEWSLKSRRHLQEKWHLAPDDAALARMGKWAARHRKLIDQSQKPWALRILPVITRRKAGNFLRRHNLRQGNELR